MRLKRIQNDFRVFEVLDESFMGSGNHTVYRVTKRGLTTPEAVARLAKEAGIEKKKVACAGLKDKDGITGQFMSIEGGTAVNFQDEQLTIRPIGKASRALTSADSEGNSFEIVVRDLSGDDMRRIRHNLAQVKKDGVPLYKLARKGKTVEREAKPIHIYSYDFTEYTPPLARFRVHCTKGTYVRSLAHDLGQSHEAIGAELENGNIQHLCYESELFAGNFGDEIHSVGNPLEGGNASHFARDNHHLRWRFLPPVRSDS